MREAAPIPKLPPLLRTAKELAEADARVEAACNAT